MTIFIIAILVQTIIFLVAVLLILGEMKKFLREVIYVLKSQNVYEAKEVLKEEPPENFEEAQVSLEDLNPEQALEILTKSKSEEVEI